MVLAVVEERPDAQIGVDALDLRRIDAAIRQRADPAVADPFADERPRHGRAARAACATATDESLEAPW